MSKVEKSWSGMRKYLEKEMLSETLKGKVRYNCTTYPGMDGCHIFEVFFDGKLFKQFSWETVNSYFLDNGMSAKPEKMSISEYWDDFWNLIEQYPIETRTEYTDNEFAAALEEYRNQDIQKSLDSNNPIVLMFALLDRRTGVRSLKKMKKSIEDKPTWIQKVYTFRTEKTK